MPGACWGKWARHCVPLSVSIQLAKVKTNGNDISIHDHEQGYNVFTRMCDVTFALISNLINKRTGAGMASLMHGFQCWLSCWLMKFGCSYSTSAANRSIGSTTGCTIMEKAPARAFSWLKAATTAFTFKTLLRHYAKQALTPWSLK